MERCAWALLFVATACGPAATDDDDFDAGPVEDHGVVDAGTSDLDAGEEGDAGRMDLGQLDGGAPDAGLEDAGADLGPEEDGGPGPCDPGGTSLLDPELEAWCDPSAETCVPAAEEYDCGGVCIVCAFDASSTELGVLRAVDIGSFDQRWPYAAACVVGEEECGGLVCYQGRCTSTCTLGGDDCSRTLLTGACLDVGHEVAGVCELTP